MLPKSPILEFLTEFSGLSCHSFARGPIVTHEDFLQKLRHLIGPDVILVGHGLKQDLLRMRLIHDKIVDTSVLFPAKVAGKTTSLSNLWKLYFHNLPLRGSNKALLDCKKTLRLLKKKIQATKGSGYLR